MPSIWQKLTKYIEKKSNEIFDDIKNKVIRTYTETRDRVKFYQTVMRIGLNLGNARYLRLPYYTNVARQFGLNNTRLLKFIDADKKKQRAILQHWQEQRFDDVWTRLKDTLVTKVSKPSNADILPCLTYLTQELDAVINHNQPYLDLSGIKLNPQIIDYINHFRKQWPTAISLDLSRCQLHDDSMPALVKLIYAKGRLGEINLAQNHFTRHSTRELLRVMAINRCLTRIDLSHLPIKADDIQPLSDSLRRRNEGDITLNLNHCNLDSAAMRYCIQPANGTARVHWYLRNNLIDDSGLTQLENTLATLPAKAKRRTVVDLRANPIYQYHNIRRCHAAGIHVLATMQLQDKSTEKESWLTGYTNQKSRLLEANQAFNTANIITQQLLLASHAQRYDMMLESRDDQWVLKDPLLLTLAQKPAVIRLFMPGSETCVAIAFVTHDMFFLQGLRGKIELNIDIPLNFCGIKKIFIDMPDNQVTLNQALSTRELVYIKASGIRFKPSAWLSSQDVILAAEKNIELSAPTQCETLLMDAENIYVADQVSVLAQCQMNARQRVFFSETKSFDQLFHCGGRLVIACDLLFVEQSLSMSQLFVKSSKSVFVQGIRIETLHSSLIESDKFHSSADFTCHGDLRLECASILVFDKNSTLYCESDVFLSSKSLIAQAEVTIVGNLVLRSTHRAELYYRSQWRVTGQLHVEAESFIVQAKKLNVGGVYLKASSMLLGHASDTQLTSRDAIVMQLQQLISDSRVVSQGHIQVYVEDVTETRRAHYWKSLSHLLIDTRELHNRGRFHAPDLVVRMKSLTNYHSGLFEAKDNLSIVGDKFWNSGTLHCFDGDGNISIALNRFLLHGIASSDLTENFAGLIHGKKIRIITPLYLNTLSTVSATRNATIMALVNFDLGFNPSTFMYKYSLLSINLSLSIPNPLTVLDIFRSIAREEYQSLFDDFFTLQNLMYGINTGISLLKIFYPKVGIIISAIWSAVNAGFIVYNLCGQLDALYSKYKNNEEIQLFELIPLIVGVSQLANVSLSLVHAGTDLNHLGHDIQQHGADAFKPPHLTASEFIAAAELMVSTFGPRNVDTSLISIDAGMTANASINHESLLSVDAGFQAGGLVTNQFLMGEVNPHVAAYNFSVDAFLAKIDSDFRACENGSLHSYFLYVDEQVKATHGSWCVSSHHLHWHNPTFTPTTVFFDINASDEYDLLYGRGRFSRTQPHKAIGLKTPHKITLNEKWNRNHLTLLLDASKVTINTDIEAESVFVTSRDKDLTISRRAKINAKKDASFVALTGSVNNQGEVKAGNHASAYARHNINNIATDSTVINSHGYRTVVHHQAVFHGGEGKGYGGIGTSLVAGNQVINDGSEISATGSNFISARHGYLERSRVVTNPRYHHHHHHHAQHRTVEAASLVSQHGKNYVISAKGGAQSIGGQFIAKAGTEFYTREDVHLDPLIFQKRSHHQRFTGMSILSRHAYDDVAIPTWVIDSGNSVIYSQKGDVYAKGALFVGPGKVKVHGKVVDMQPTLLNHHHHDHERGISVSLMGMHFKHGARYRSQAKQADPLLAKLFDINKHGKPSPDGGAWNLGLATYDAVCQFAKTSANGAFLKGLLQRFGLADSRGFNPSATIGLSDRDSRHRYQTVSPNGLFRGSVDIDASERVHLGNGMQATITHDMHIKTPSCLINGTALDDSSVTREVAASVGISAKGGVTCVGGSYQRSSSRGTRYQDANIHVGGTLHLDCDELTLDGAHIDADAVTGRVGRMKITSQQSHYHNHTTQVGFSTAGDVSYANFHQRVDRTSQASGISTQKPIKTHGHGSFTVGELQSQGGGISSQTSGDYVPKHHQQLPYEDRSKQSGWSFSGNITQILPASSSESVALPTANLAYAKQSVTYATGSDKVAAKHGVNFAVDVPLVSPSGLIPATSVQEQPIESTFQITSTDTVAKTEHSTLIQKASEQTVSDTDTANMSDEVFRPESTSSSKETTSRQKSTLAEKSEDDKAELVSRDNQKKTFPAEVFETSSLPREIAAAVFNDESSTTEKRSNYLEAFGSSSHQLGGTIEELSHSDIIHVRINGHVTRGLGLLGTALDFVGYLNHESEEGNPYAVADAGMRTGVHVAALEIPLYGIEALDIFTAPLVIAQGIGELGEWLDSPYQDAYESNLIYNGYDHPMQQVQGALTDLGMRHLLSSFSHQYHDTIEAASNYVISSRPYQATRGFIYDVASQTNVVLKPHSGHWEFNGIDIGFTYQFSDRPSTKSQPTKRSTRPPCVALLLHNSGLFYNPNSHRLEHHPLSQEQPACQPTG